MPKTYRLTFTVPDAVAEKMTAKNKQGVPLARIVTDALAAHLRPHRKGKP